MSDKQPVAGERGMYTPPAQTAASSFGRACPPSVPRAPQVVDLRRGESA